MWRAVGTTKVPNWVEAGTRNVFVDSASVEVAEGIGKHERAYRAKLIIIGDESFKISHSA